MSKGGSRYGRRSNWFKIHCLLQEQSERTFQMGEGEDSQLGLPLPFGSAFREPKVEPEEVKHNDTSPTHQLSSPDSLYSGDGSVDVKIEAIRQSSMPPKNLSTIFSSRISSPLESLPTLSPLSPAVASDVPRLPMQYPPYLLSPAFYPQFLPIQSSMYERRKTFTPPDFSGMLSSSWTHPKVGSTVPLQDEPIDLSMSRNKTDIPIDSEVSDDELDIDVKEEVHSDIEYTPLDLSH